MTTYQFRPTGVCSRQMEIDLRDDGVVEDVRITSGCDGNLKGIIALSKGQPARDLVKRLQGIRCGLKETSCPDQLAIALTQALEAAEACEGGSSAD